MYDSYRKPLFSTIVAFSILLTWCLAPLGAGAAQFTCIDEDYVHNYWYKHFDFPWQPSDWTSPDDYSHGRAYFRVEVRSLSMPIYGWYSSNSMSDPYDFIADLWAPQLCLFQDAHVSEKHACFTSATIAFNQPGLYYAEKEVDACYQYNVIDWTRELMNPMVIAKVIDPYGHGYANQLVDMRFTVILVAEGDTFDPPAWWDDLSSVTETEEQTWGALKALYR